MCSRLTLRARHTRSHSAWTFSKPRKLNRRNPITSLIQPTGASAIHLRRAYRLLPSSLASFLAMRAFAGYLSGSGSMTAVPSRASDTYPSMSRSFRACRFGSLQ